MWNNIYTKNIRIRTCTNYYNIALLNLIFFYCIYSFFRLGLIRMTKTILNINDHLSKSKGEILSTMSSIRHRVSLWLSLSLPHTLFLEAHFDGTMWEYCKRKGLNEWQFVNISLVQMTLILLHSQCAQN